jgi:hypothetical protein
MKYYATKIGTDPEGNPTILKQIEVGIPLANYWEMRNVCDSTGNTYYSYGATICKVPADIESIDEVVEINVNTALGLSGYEVLGLALDYNHISNQSEYLYILINTLSTATNSRFYKISISDFSLSSDNLHIDLTGDSYSSGVIFFSIDKYNNIWGARSTVASTSTLGFVIDSDTLTVSRFGGDGNWKTGIGIIDQNGTQFIFNNSTYDSGYNKAIYDSGIITRTWSNGISTSYIIDALTDKDNNIWLIYNPQNGTTQNKIYKITDLTGTPSLTETINLTKEDLTTPLYYCYNLHTNSDGDIFFSTYNVIDGYNTYKIAYGTTTIELYIAGLGSKTTGNDPYAFFLSRYGHTGANI